MKKMPKKSNPKKVMMKTKMFRLTKMMMKSKLKMTKKVSLMRNTTMTLLFTKDLELTKMTTRMNKTRIINQMTIRMSSLRRMNSFRKDSSSPLMKVKLMKTKQSKWNNLTSSIDHIASRLLVSTMKTKKKMRQMSKKMLKMSQMMLKTFNFRTITSPLLWMVMLDSVLPFTKELFQPDSPMMEIVSCHQ